MQKTKAFHTVLRQNFYSTQPTGGACGVYIDVKSKDTDWIFFGTNFWRFSSLAEIEIDVFVSGKVSDKKININSCGGNRPWSKDVKKELAKISKINYAPADHGSDRNWIWIEQKNEVLLCAVNAWFVIFLIT